MKYISTRGQAPAASFEEVLLTGLAPDGGLYVPESLPSFSQDEIRSWQGLAYDDLAFKVMAPFVDGAIADDELKAMIKETYQQFNHKAVAPLTQLSEKEFVLELFHGPTLAFKDFALQLLGRLLDSVLKKRDEKVVIMGATSGDTGSAAIEGCRACENVDIFILHPHNRVSEVQRRQMTTAIGKNIHNIAIEGNFDDCQSIVKQSFNDQSFLKGQKRLVAVNSINWARIMAQIVYYFYASLTLGGPDKSISFSVPTGNFGDIFAGYLAKKMGLPIDRLIIATNTNDILHRVVSANNFEASPLKHTLSPSMDIMVSSNFERFLFDVFNRDGAALKNFMDNINENDVSISDDQLSFARGLFNSARVSDEETCDTIKSVFEDTAYVLDPHTAIGVKAARECLDIANMTSPVVNLATAHPVKFAEAIEKAGLQQPPLPPHLSDLMEREEAFDILPNDIKKVQDFVSGLGLK